MNQGEKSKTKGWLNNTKQNKRWWHIITCAGRETGENSSTLKWDLRHSPMSSIFSVNTFQSGKNESLFSFYISQYRGSRYDE